MKAGTVNSVNIINMHDSIPQATGGSHKQKTGTDVNDFLTAIRDNYKIYTGIPQSYVPLGSRLKP
jgi:hypothetical protein